MQLLFPFKGKHKGLPAGKQPAGTSPNLQNVRVFDVLDDRGRGGQRPGMAKKYTQQIGGTAYPIVAICSVTVVN